MDNKNIITYIVNKNLNNELLLTVENGEVVIDAPWYYTKTQIQKIILEKRNWITNKIEENKIKNEKKYIRNEIVKIFGEDCRVKINYKNLKKPTLTVEGKNIKICLPNKYKKLDREEILERLIEKLYDMLANKEIEPIMEKIRKKVGFAPEDYKIVRSEKMADCIKQNVIIINPDIIKYKKEEIEYILLHQFAHLKFKTHSKGFIKLVEENCINYKKYEEKFKNIIF